MQKIVCDKCGEEIIDKINEVLLQRRKLGCQKEKRGEFDLCDLCVNEFYDFLDSEEHIPKTEIEQMVNAMKSEKIGVEDE